MTVLVTAFDPFGGETLNPALAAARRLPPEIAGAEIIVVELPTVFGRSVDLVTAAMDELRPDAVVCLGQAGGRAAITPERVAINVDDARIPDNAGQQPIDRPIVAGGPPAYFATLPVKAMVQAIRDEGLPAELSNTAGTFVCNHLMYGVIHHAAGHPGMRAGFVHVPFIPQQVAGRGGIPAMGLDEIVRGLTAAIAAAVYHSTDIALAAGAVH